jgi:hypothetical protein
MATKTYTVTCDSQAARALGELADRLRGVGFHVTRQLDAIGVLVGRADEADLVRIRRVRGVAAIEEERQVEPKT